MTLDANVAGVLVALFAVTNTALLVWQSVRLGQVHTAVNSALDASVAAAHAAGVAAGVLAVTGQAPPVQAQT